MIGIYKIECKNTHKVYIGQSIHIEKRWREHKNDLNNNCHFNKYLQRAWNKYGEQNFIFSVLEQCTKQELNDKETYWFLKNKSNCFNLGQTGNVGTMSDEQKQRLSEVNKGKKLSAETKEKISKKLKGKVVWNIGRKASNETKLKMRLAQLGKKKKPLTDEQKEHIRAGHIGIKYSKESIEKRAAKRRGIPRSEETKRKISETQKGYKPSQETIEKLRKSHLGQVPFNKGRKKVNGKYI